MKGVVDIGSRQVFGVLLIGGGIFDVIEGRGFGGMMGGWGFGYVMMYGRGWVEWVVGMLVVLGNVRMVGGKRIGVYVVVILGGKLFGGREGIGFGGEERRDECLVWIRVIGEGIVIIWVMWIGKWEKKVKE